LPQTLPNRRFVSSAGLSSDNLDVDASFDADDLRGATGAVIRDCNGSFVAAA
jgi:hypothetical protein